MTPKTTKAKDIKDFKKLVNSIKKTSKIDTEILGSRDLNISSDNV